ncbi:MAG: nucleotide exchange factor GrpE [Deltaproteobacteria bacterium]|jgi:molecular chaperone GrpE|nr:nucleotide exchange factor GrpE [Deltaproteobacteria bacterium]MBW2535029.1 nucleotide exchange factor GrpE [Deltaproteobacteria bacterium]
MDERDTSSEPGGTAGEAIKAIVDEPVEPAEAEAAGAAPSENGEAAPEEAEPSAPAGDAPAAEDAIEQGPAEAAEQHEAGGAGAGAEDDQAASAKQPDAKPEPTAEEQLAEARAATERVRQQMLRVAADFDNFRKRTVRDLDDARVRARQGVVRDFLPVFDNLERAVGHASEAPDPAAFAEGIRMVLKQLDDTLRRLGIERVEARGAPFDPSLHESIQMVESTEHEVGIVVSVIQPGYRHGDALLRPALVTVSKGPPAPPAEEPAAEASEEAASDEAQAAADGAQDEPGGTGEESAEGSAAEPPAPAAGEDPSADEGGGDGDDED